MEPSVNLKDAAQVEEAIGRARRYAQEQGVPLTMERVAACLGAGRKEIQAAIEQAQSCRGTGSRSQKAAGKALEAVSSECRAVLMELGLSRSSSPVMPIFGLKANFGYTDRPTEEPSFETVRFEGEDEIPE